MVPGHSQEIGGCPANPGLIVRRDQVPPCKPVYFARPVLYNENLRVEAEELGFAVQARFRADAQAFALCS